MGRIDLIKDITQEQLDAKATEATEASEALILEMLNEIKASKDFPVDEQLLPLFNQDLETIFQAFGESVKNQDKYKDQEHFEISTI
ncbi:MAG: hypothetical protein LBG59_02935 [Candidatus Peribacteria bacterium]|jgi:hypothetical protein|nr:hypothetical protein [Candidatus Peribacteria bacterium]